MFNYPEKAKKEATHTDDVGYLYKVVGDKPVQYCVYYWDLRLNRWCQDMGVTFPHLVKL